jgi:hypothetical protein
MSSMRPIRVLLNPIVGCLFVICALAPGTCAQHDREDPTATMTFLVIKEESGKPIRNAAVIMHPVGNNGKQSRGGLELKTDADGRTSFDGVPYGKLRVQVLASGFQTYGEDFDVDRDKLSVTVKLKRPQGQYSIYESHPQESKDDKTPPADPNAKPQ